MFTFDETEISVVFKLMLPMISECEFAKANFGLYSSEYPFTSHWPGPVSVWKSLVKQDMLAHGIYLLANNQFALLSEMRIWIQRHKLGVQLWRPIDMKVPATHICWSTIIAKPVAFSREFLLALVIWPNVKMLLATCKPLVYLYEENSHGSWQFKCKNTMEWGPWVKVP